MVLIWKVVALYFEHMHENINVVISSKDGFMGVYTIRRYILKLLVHLFLFVLLHAYLFIFTHYGQVVSDLID